MSLKADQRRYVDVVAISAFTAMMVSPDPVGVIRATLETALADQSSASERAALRRMAPAASDWFERVGRKAIVTARPAFPVSAGTVVNSSSGLRAVGDDPFQSALDGDDEEFLEGFGW